MIESIDQRSVCGHLKATLSGHIQDDKIQAAVGTMVNMDPSSFEQVAKELATVFTGAIRGEFNIPREEIPHIGVTKGYTVYLDRNGNPVYGTCYKDDWIDECLHLPHNPQTHKIWAGLTNLKSACVIKTLSRSEKDAQYEAFSHTVDIDPEFEQEWIKFVDEFTPYLVERLQLLPDRTYDPLWTTPASETKHSVTLGKDGKLVTCLRGSAEYADPRLQLRHPAINRIALKYQKEFAEAVFLGYSVTGDVQFDVPEPFDTEPPIGRGGIAPKRAQKPRTVWIALAILDSMSRPAFHKLEEIEARWNIQGVMDHDGSRRRIQHQLKHNVQLSHKKTFCSYDQSAFTDNFSYTHVQRHIVVALVREGILLPYDLDVIDTINYGRWDLKALGRKYDVKPFGTGTGMGTPPSFPLASVANGYLVAYSYWKAYNRFPSMSLDRAPGIVVGDDCCVFDAATGDQYELVCSRIGLKINQSKSFRSEDTAEFCGKFITPDGVYDKHKLIDFTDPAGLVDLVTYYGDHSEEFFKEFQEELGIVIINSVRKIREIPQPYGAKEFQYHETPFSELSSVDKMATTYQEVGDLESILTPDIRERQRDFREIIRRKSKFPEIRCTDTTPLVEEERVQKPVPDQLVQALVHNALRDYYLAQGQTWVKLVQVSEQVNAVWTAIHDNDPDYFRNHAQLDQGRILPKPTKGVPESLTRRLSDLVVDPPQISEGGVDFEF